MKNKLKVVVIGLGGMFHELKDKIWDRYEVIALGDNDKSKHGTKVNDVKVFPVELIHKKNCQFVFLLSMYSDEISEQLILSGVEQTKIIHLSNLGRFIDSKKISELSPRLCKQWSEIERKKDTDKKNILFVCNSLGIGGLEKALIEILGKLSDKEYNINLLIVLNKGELLEYIPSHVSVIKVIEDANLFSPAMYYLISNSPEKIYENIVSSKYDVEISFSEGVSTKIISGSRCKNKIAWVHCDYLTHHYTNYIYKKKQELNCFMNYEHIVFVSEYARLAWCEKFSAIDETKTKVIHLFIDTDNLINKCREKLIINNGFTIVSVGRLEAVKGYERLIKAHKRICDLGYNTNLIIVGSGSLQAGLARLIIKLNISATVQLVGYHENVYPYVNSADVFVSPSYSESYSLSIGEAMLLGKPIIATKTSGARELLANGEFGIMVDNSEDGIYFGIKKILDNRELIDSYSKLSKVRSANFFSVSPFMEKLKLLLDG